MICKVNNVLFKILSNLLHLKMKNLMLSLFLIFLLSRAMANICSEQLNIFSDALERNEDWALKREIKIKLSVIDNFILFLNF